MGRLPQWGVTTVNLILFGPPGAGKGTQSKLLCERFRLCHLSTGDVIRAAIRSGSEFGLSVKQRVERGELISDDDVTRLVELFVGERRSQTDSFLFDGFPRNIAQIDRLEEICQRFRLTEPAVVTLDVDEEVLELRITGRRICLECKGTFNVHYNPPPKEKGCGFTVCPMLQRADDTSETVRERLRIYREQTRPVLQHYEALGRLSSVEGTGGTEDVFQRICDLLVETY